MPAQLLLLAPVQVGRSGWLRRSQTVSNDKIKLYFSA